MIQMTCLISIALIVCYFIMIIILVIVVAIDITYAIAIPEVWKPRGPALGLFAVDFAAAAVILGRPSTLQRCASPITIGNLD